MIGVIFLQILNCFLGELDQLVYFLNCRFMYTDNTDITIDNLEGLLRCAKRFETDFLVEFCNNFLKEIITQQTVCRALQIAQRSNETKMIKFCSEKFRFLRQNSLLMLLGTDDFLNMRSTCVLEIVRDNQSYAPEEFIFDKVVLWSKETCKRIFDGPVTVENQRWILRDIIKEIRFPIMEHQYLHDVVCTSKILNDEEKVDILRQQLKTSRKSNDCSPCRFTCEPQK